VAVLGEDHASNLVKAGLRLSAEGRVEEAMAQYRSAIAANPSLAFAHSCLGDAFAQSSRPNEAIEAYKKAYALEPSWHSVQIAIAQTLKVAQRHDEAIAMSREAVAKQPDNGRALEALAQATTSVCEWDDRDAIFSRLAKVLEAEHERGVVPSNVHPWNAATYPFDADLVLRISRSYADNISNLAAKQNCPPLAHPPRRELLPGQRLRVAYISSEFCDHPLGHLMNSVFGLHNRDKFEVFVYALKKSDGSKWAKRIEESSEHFLDVSAWDTVRIAKHISDSQVHIAFNLNGWTKSHRNEVFALKCAPIQVQFLGFPATMGAPWIDYIVVDPVAVPPSSEHCYSEALAMMPHSFICTDHRQAHADLLELEPPRRSDIGLPEEGMVYMCSNQLFKILPDLFDTWCRILKRVPGSVIWLLKSPEAAEPRLKKHMLRHGLDPARMILTPRMPKVEYIRRMKVADLFLDTTIYNAFTTGCDAMWAGCPVLTMPLERLASRAAASSCCATGLGQDMLVSSLEEYEERAVFLGLNPDALQDLKQRLRDARLTCPLYDTHTWVRDFECLLQKIWSRHAAGQGPGRVEVTASPPLPAAERKELVQYLPDPPLQIRRPPGAVPQAVAAAKPLSGTTSTASKPAEVVVAASPYPVAGTSRIQTRSSAVGGSAPTTLMAAATATPSASSSAVPQRPAVAATYAGQPAVAGGTVRYVQMSPSAGAAAVQTQGVTTAAATSAAPVAFTSGRAVLPSAAAPVTSGVRHIAAAAAPPATSPVVYSSSSAIGAFPARGVAPFGSHTLPARP